MVNPFKFTTAKLIGCVGLQAGQFNPVDNALGKRKLVLARLSIPPTVTPNFPVEQIGLPRVLRGGMPIDGHGGGRITFPLDCWRWQMVRGPLAGTKTNHFATSGGATTIISLTPATDFPIYCMKITRRFLPLAAVLALGMIPAHSQALPVELEDQRGLVVLIGGANDWDPDSGFFDSDESRVIHWLTPDETSLAQVRGKLQARGVYGRVSAARWDGERLPYASNLVNAIVVRSASEPPDEEEILRVLAPNGTAYLPGDEGTETLHKPRPDDMADWTHPWQGPDGNLASADRAFGVPNTIQWLAAPSFAMAGRKSSTGAIVTAGGRVFMITQNVSENLGDIDGPYHLVARNAFNGTVLWSRPWDGLVTRFFRGFLDSLVASESIVYTADSENVLLIDAATGELLDTWEVPAQPEKFVLSDGVLVAQTGAGLVGFDVETEEQLWHFEAEMLNRSDVTSTLARDGQVFCLLNARQDDGRWEYEVLALNIKDGSELWRQPVEGEFVHRAPQLRLHFIGDGMICTVERNYVRGLATEDGRELWRRETGATSRGASYDSRQVGHFFIDGKVWIRQTQASEGRDDPETWVALDPMTGEVEREISVTGDMGVLVAVNKQACSPLVATERFVIDSRLATVWALEEGQRKGMKFIRGGCQVGMIPANGLGYLPPNVCACTREQVRGFLAIVHDDDPGLTVTEPGPLVEGTAYGKKPDAPNPSPAWPVYRGDNLRSAHYPDRASEHLKEKWKVRLDVENGMTDQWRLRQGRLVSPPTIADGLMFLALPQTHEIVALDQDTGDERWRFTAGGRISVPPVYHEGLALFGAHDGFVYALDAKDGGLVWKRRAAPSERLIMVDGQLESTWPVATGVMVQDGRLLAVAGRSPDSDGGLVLQSFDPFTGEHHWSQRIEDALDGVFPLLVADDAGQVFVMDQMIDLDSGEVSPAPRDAHYLQDGSSGILDNSWTMMPLALRKQISSRRWGENHGQAITFDGDVAFAFRSGVLAEEPQQVESWPRGLLEVNLPRGGWRFQLDPEGQGDSKSWYDPEFDDSDWREDVPIRVGWQRYLDTPYHGVAWYRNSFAAPEFPEGDIRIELSFLGVDEEAWVWLNGEFVGSHEMGPEGWNIPFQLDVEEVIRPGEENHLAVKVRNSASDGGIWQPVTLRVLARDATQWSQEWESPEQVEAMVSTKNLVYLAGPADRDNPDGPGFLKIWSRGDGTELERLELDAAPVYDGLAISNGSLTAILRNGEVVLFDFHE